MGMMILYVLNWEDSENILFILFKVSVYEKDYYLLGLFISYEDKYGVEIVGKSLFVFMICGISMV